MNNIISGRYKIETRVGAGGMAVVYKAKDIRSGKTVAVKVLRPQLSKEKDYIERFEHEADAASKMFHENIVTTLDYGVDGENRYIVMDYIEGETLKQLIRRKGRLSVKTAVPMIIRILAAVNYAHRNKIIHRDIKPQNILVDRQGIIKVADFGIARSLRKEDIITEGNGIGSVHYISPEQAKGETADEASDLYSVGIVAYEMLTGVVPFDGATENEVLHKQIEEQPRSMRELEPDIPKALDEVVMRALCKDKTKRYRRAGDMAADFKKAIKKPRGGFVQLPMTADEKERKHRNKIKRIALILVCSFIVLLSLGVIAARIYINYRNERLKQYASMPSVVGNDVESASQLMDDAGLKYSFENFYSDDYQTNTVLSQSEDAGEWVSRDETVTLTVCVGTKSVPVPKVTGMTEEEAKEFLTDNSFYDINVEYIPDASNIGLVIVQSPAAEESVTRGAPVTITVGAKPCTVPDVKGMSKEAAELTIAAAGLKTGKITEVDVEGGAAGTVYSQSIEPETMVAADTVVDIKVINSQQSVFYIDEPVKVELSTDDCEVMLAVQKPSGYTFTLTMTDQDKGVHYYSISSYEKGTHVIDIYINGEWVSQIARDFNGEE